jgi:hypothetical protein
MFIVYYNNQHGVSFFISNMARVPRNTNPSLKYTWELLIWETRMHFKGKKVKYG